MQLRNHYIDSTVCMKWPFLYSVTEHSLKWAIWAGCCQCSCILLNFFHPWTAVECGEVNKASSSMWRVKICVHWSVTSDIVQLPSGSSQSTRTDGDQLTGLRFNKPSQYATWVKSCANLITTYTEYIAMHFLWCLWNCSLAKHVKCRFWCRS